MDKELRKLLEEEAAKLVVEMDRPTPEVLAQVREFCARDELHKAIYEAVQRSWDQTLILKKNRPLQ